MPSPQAVQCQPCPEASSRRQQELGSGPITRWWSGLSLILQLCSLPKMETLYLQMSFAGLGRSTHPEKNLWQDFPVLQVRVHQITFASWRRGSSLTRHVIVKSHKLTPSFISFLCLLFFFFFPPYNRNFHQSLS